MGVKRLCDHDGVSKNHVRSKFLRVKSDRQKVIDDWAYGGRNAKAIDLGRNSGQMSENVTEEKMLQESLLIMSRERQRFLQQNRYDKILFLEKQKKKSAVLKERLQHVDVDNIKSKRVESNENVAISAAQKRLAPDSEILARRKAVQDRPNKRKPESAPVGGRPKADGTAAKRRAITRAGYSGDDNASTTTSSSEASSLDEDRVFSTEIPKRKKFEGNRRKGTPELPSIQRNTEYGAPYTAGPRDGYYVPALIKPDHTHANRAEIESVASWAKKGMRQGPREAQGPVTDIRYLELEKHLTEAYPGRPETPSVHEIIRQITSLHQDGKGRVKLNRNPKLATRIMSHVVQLGLCAT